MANKVTVEATQMSEATATHISLVKRGANRVPIRIIKHDKQENSMSIDIGKAIKGAFTAKKSEVKQGPTVVALVVEKSDHMEAVTGAVRKAGFTVEFAEDRDDGTVMLKQADGELDMEGTTVVKMGDNLVLLMKGYNPYCLEDASFMEVLKAQGFYPAASAAINALQTTIDGILYEAEAGGTDVVAKVESALSDFGAYVLDQVKQIPATAFKAEKAVGEAIAASKIAKAEKDAQAGAGTAEKADKACPECGDMNSADATVCKSCGAGMDGKAKKDGEGEVTKPEVPAAAAAQPDPAIDEVKKAVGDLTSLVTALKTSLDGITKKMDSIEGGQKELTTKVAEVETVAKSASASVRGVVVGSTPAGDADLSHTVKADGEESDPLTGTFDTAFITKSERNRRPGAGRH